MAYKTAWKYHMCIDITSDKANEAHTCQTDRSSNEDKLLPVIT